MTYKAKWITAEKFEPTAEESIHSCVESKSKRLIDTLKAKVVDSISRLEILYVCAF